ncbi:MAG TPA: hypothetical protein DCE41_05990 [Cytophagales bacterium]|nr:hypothetical protein [Cytophagales bacterium]HAA21981.1 hypothetical protein [Cytophagales bacterium]HAP63796.1 hypothetical protein [Cytophagales bacterium]
MAKPVKIKYSSSVKITVSNADNSLTAILAPDTSGPGGRRTQVYGYEADGFAAGVGASLDITDSVNAARNTGSSATLVMIGSNFRGGGQFTFSVESDQAGQSQSISTNLAAFTSEQWAFDLEKV